MKISIMVRNILKNFQHRTIRRRIFSESRDNKVFLCQNRKTSSCYDDESHVKLATLDNKSSKMADVPIDCDFPVWGLLPKKETGVVSFLNKNPNYDGRGTIIAILDSGVDPAAAGLQVTSTGETKVIERFDCSGCGDVDTSTIITKVVDGCITGLTGRKLTIPESWQNPSGEWRVGVLYPFSLYPTKLKERVQEHRREHLWDARHKPAFANANKDLQDFETEHASGALTADEKLLKEELEARVEVLQTADKKYTDVGPTYDCVLYHDGTVWRACIDTSERGSLADGRSLAEYSVTHEHAHLTPLDEMTVSINVHDQGDTLEVVGMCSTHGTHVAAIAAGYFAPESERNGAAPGARLVSLGIGDARLGSMETGTALVRACIKMMELSAAGRRVDVVNMSYGEHAHWANAGRCGEMISSVVTRYGATWVVSAGNHGPALGTVGAPPDLAQDLLIGVGAYVSSSMMTSAYSMRALSVGGAFTWSSRGPATDGALGVSVCAPGGAVASVARFTLRNSQLMNGTSMAAPHVAGATALLISGLKGMQLPYSPYSVKRALENSASYLSHVEPWAQGCGLLNVEKAFDLLTTYHDAPERDVRFAIQCGSNQAKGIFLRPKLDDAPKDIGITVEPHFLQVNDTAEKPGSLEAQIGFSVRLALCCSAAWVSAPAHLHLMNAARPLALRLRTAELSPGPHYASITAYDVACVEKGPLFRVHMTVLQPQRLDGAAPALVVTGREYRPAHIERHVLLPPADASWGVLRLSTRDQDATGRFLIHTMQLLPRRSCRCHETQKMVNVSAEAPAVLPFQIVGGVTLEVAIAKYWANLGDMTVSYSIELHGLRPLGAEVGAGGAGGVGAGGAGGAGGGRLVVSGAMGLRPVVVRALRHQDCQPVAQLKYTEPVYRPQEHKLRPLTSRDVVPPGRQIYQLINTYNFHLAKGTEVSPIVTLVSDMLYESELESQMWMLYNSSKQLMAVGDAYPSKYSVKLEKGEYVVRVSLRHESRALLERLTELPLVLQQRLPQPLSLDVYAHHHLALTGGKKFSSTVVSSGTMLPLYLAALPADKISRSNLTIGQTLSGSVTFSRDELGRKADWYELQYIVPEPPPRRNNNNNNNNANNSKEKEKSALNDDYLVALRDFKTSWLAKLETSKAEALYEEVVRASEGADLAAHVAYLAALDPPADVNRLPDTEMPPEVTMEWCENIINIADKVIKQVDQEKLLAYLGLKNDTRLEASKIKQEQEKQRGYLIEALCRRGTALCRQLALTEAREGREGRETSETSEGSKEPLVSLMKENMATLLKFTDITDTKALQYGVWHWWSLQHWARALRLLQRLADERPSRELDSRLQLAATRLAWPHLAAHLRAAAPLRYPRSYRPF